MTEFRRIRFQMSLSTMLVIVTAFSIGFLARNILDGYHATYMGYTVPTSTSPVTVGEVLKIECDVNKRYDREVVVFADGVIKMPVIGTFDVHGQTPDRIQELLNNKFAEMGASNVNVEVFRSASHRKK